MVDTRPLDLANFLFRNRQAGGVNAQLADALAQNLAPQQTQPAQPAQQGPIVPGLFGVGRNGPSDQGERPRPAGGSLSALASILTGGAAAVPSMLGALTLSDALGLSPSVSLNSTLRSAFRDRDRPERRDISRPDRTRSSSNREAGGGLTE